jgi:hypothetical protein
MAKFLTGINIVGDALSISGTSAISSARHFAATSITSTGDIRTGTSTLTANTNFDNLIIEGSAHTGITIFSGTSSDGGIYFGDSGANNLGQIKYLHSSNAMTFATNDGAASLTLDSGLNATFAGHVSGTRFILPSTASAANQWIYTNNTNTGTGSLTIQAGAGSAGYGGGLILYSHAHASKPGWVKAGISSGSGGKFAVNTTGTGGGTDVFTVDASGNGLFSGTVTATAFTGTASNANLLDNLDSNKFAYYNALTFADGTELTSRSGTFPTPGRSTTVYPASYGRTFNLEFKSKPTMNNPGTGSSWLGIMSMAPYATGASFYTTQIAIGADGTNADLYVRRGNGTGNGTWGSWRQIITADSATFTDSIYMGNTVTNPASGFADQTGIGLKYSTTVPEIQVSSDSTAMQLGRTSTGGAGQILAMRAASTTVHNFQTTYYSTTGWVDAANYKIGGAQGSDGQVLTSTGSGVAWEAATANFTGGTVANATTFSSDVTFSTVQISSGSSYNENIRMFPGSNGYSSLILGAVSGTSGTGAGQWSLVRYPAASSYLFSIRHNSSNIMEMTTAGITTFSGDINRTNTGSGDAKITLKSTTGGDPTVVFNSAAANRSGALNFQDNGVQSGQIVYNHSGDHMRFYTGGASSAAHLELALNETAGATFRTTVKATNFIDVDNTAYYVNPSASSLLAGNVTIGSYSTSGGNTLAILNSTGDQTIRLADASANYGFDIVNDDGGFLHIIRHANSAVGVSALTIKRDTGAIGIGTITPDAPLTILGATGLGVGASGIRVHRPDSFGQFAFMDYGQSSGTAYFGSSYTGGTAAQYGVIAFRQLSNGGTATNSLILGVDKNATFSGNVTANHIYANVGNSYDVGAAGTMFNQAYFNEYHASTKFQGPIFYDSANTAYYVDPSNGANGISANLQGRIQVGTFTNSQNNTGEAWIGRASDRSAGCFTVQLGGGAGRSFEVVDSGWTTVEFSVSDSGLATAAGSFRAPIFYDSGNTAYYTDPASESVFNLSSFGGRASFAANNTNSWDTIATTTGSLGCLEVYNNGGGVDAFMAFHVGGDFACYFGLDGGTNKLSVGGWSMGAASYEIYHAGNKPSLATLGYTGATNANYITNNNQLTNGAAYITASGTSADSNLLDGTDWNSAASRRKLGLSALTTYDRNSSSTSSAYHTGAMGWGAVDFNTLLTYGSGFFDTWSSPANQPSSETSHWNGHQVLHYTSSSTYHHGYQMAVGAGNPAYCYIRGWWANGGSGSGWAKMYNSHNLTSWAGLGTGTWYGDLGSYGYTRETGLSMTGGSEFVVLSKSGQGSVLVDGAYLAYESANGFFGSYNSTYGNLTGIRATAANTLTVTQLDGGSAILTVTQDCRAPIFYDSNNTGYYIDGASNSHFNTITSNSLQTTNGLLFGNYGTGVTGLYSASRIQTIFNMGAAYKINDGGTSVTGAYGLYWSHQNAGSLGGANNLASHGILIIENGTYKGSWGGGRLVTPSDIRGTMFYDYNNTAYYGDFSSYTYGKYYGRIAHNEGFQVGSYNNVGSNHAASNPIYTIGSSYMPAATTLSNMYGVGYTGVSSTFISFTGQSDWGFYVAADGDARVWLDGSNGNICTAGNTYAAIHYDYNNTAYYVNPDSSSSIVNLTVANTITGSITRTAGTSGYGHAGTGMWAFYNWGGSNGGASAPTTSTYTTGISVGSHPGDQAYGFQLGNNMWNRGLWMRDYNSGFSSWYQMIDTTSNSQTKTGLIQSNASLRAPIFYDSNNTAYYIDPATNGHVLGNFEFAASSTATGYDTAAIEIRESNYSGSGGTPPRIGFHHGGVVASNITIESSGRIAIRNNPGNGYENFIANNSYASTSFQGPMYYDSTNTAYYTRPASSSNINSLYTAGLIQAGASGTGNIYVGGTSGHHFRFHTNNSATYFDMNCGDMNWRQGSSTRFIFYSTTANMTIYGSLSQGSDIRVKENIVEIDSCIDKVKSIRGVYYNRTDFNTEQTKIGVIAQEVEVLMPELVDDNGVADTKSVAYTELTAVLVNAVKEQQVIIDDLKSRIETLENN